MNWQAFRHSRKALGLTVAAGTAFVGLGVASTPVFAQSDVDNTQAASNGVSVSILSPFQSSAFQGAKKIEVSAFYQAVQGGGIQTIELDIDGARAATKQLDNPEGKGIISFLVDPSTLSSGNHRIAVRVVSSDDREATATTSFHYTGESAMPSGIGSIDPATPGAPALSIEGIRQNQYVSGIVVIKVHVVDPSGKSPYVSLFVDNVFKVLQNYAPYTFNWDTRTVNNGPHTIEVSGFSDETEIGKSGVLHVQVNNGGGPTSIEDIQDTAPVQIAPIPKTPQNPAPVAPSPHDLATSLSDTGTSPAIPSTDAAMNATHGTFAHSPAPMSNTLASANLGDSGISMETILNAPFLAHKAPVTPDEITPKTSASMVVPSLPGAPDFDHAPMQMASAKIDADDLSAETLLAAPFLRAQAAPPPPAQIALPLTDPEVSLPGVQGNVGGATIEPGQSTSSDLTAPTLSPQIAPKPAAVAPKPAAVNVQPTVAAPKPAAVAVQPTVAAPKPAAVAVQPTVAAPKPAAVAVKPTVAAPKPAPVAVKPAVAAPKPAAVAAQPVPVSKPVPVAAPKPAKVAAATPVIEAPHIAVAVTHAPAVAPVQIANTMVGSGLVDNNHFAPDLSAPEVHAPMAAPKPAKVAAVKPVIEAPHIAVAVPHAPAVAPVQIANAMVGSGLVDNNHFTPDLSAPEVHAPMAAPQMAMPNVEIHVKSVTSRYQMASASIDNSTQSLGSLTLKTPVMVPQTRPVAGRPTPEIAGVAHHTVDVFSKDVTERVRGSYVLVMDDHAVKLNQPLQDRDNVLCAPLRQIFEGEGGVIGWSPNTKEVRAVTSNRDVLIKIGSRTAKVNGESTSLKTAPYISNNRTMIPVGFLPLALNVSVSFDPITGHVLINSKG